MSDSKPDDLADAQYARGWSAGSDFVLAVIEKMGHSILSQSIRSGILQGLKRRLIETEADPGHQFDPAYRPRHTPIGYPPKPKHNRPMMESP